MSVTRHDLATNLLNAAASGSLLTPRHDPASASVAMRQFRTVLTPSVSSSLCGMLTSESFSADEYKDLKHTNATYVLTPTGSYGTLASSIPSGSTAQTGTFDRLIAVEGKKQGWHLFAENQATIDARLAAGSITHVATLT